MILKVQRKKGFWAFSAVAAIALIALGIGVQSVRSNEGAANAVKTSKLLGVSLGNQAQTFATRMLPVDAKKLQTRKGINGQRVDVYQSKGLSTQFGQEVFGQGSGTPKPGIFDVSYVTGAGAKITEVDFAVGDNS